MSRYLWFWVVWLIVGAAYEVWAVWVRPAGDDTLSEFTARVFHSGTTAGYAALMALMWGLALWFPLHTRRFDKRPPVKAAGSKSETR